MSPTKRRRTTRGCSQQVVGAVARACAVMRGRCARALGQTAGFTLTEALTTVIIVGLVTTILAGGIGLATRQYTQQMSNSEAQMLYSSLQKILDTELRFVDNFTCDAHGNVTDFESKHYMAQGPDLANMKKTTKLSSLTRLPGDIMVPTNPGTPGQLAMATGYDDASELYNPLLPSAAYNYGLQASVKTFTYNKGKNYFTLRLVISRPDGETRDGQILVAETFTVRPLNFSATGTVTSSGNVSVPGNTVTIGASGPKTVYVTLPKPPLPSDATIDVVNGNIYKYGDDYFIATTDEIVATNGKYDVVPGSEGTNGNPTFVKLVGYDPDNNKFDCRPADEANQAGRGEIVEKDGKYYVKIKKQANNSNVGSSGNWCLIEIKPPSGS